MKSYGKAIGSAFSELQKELYPEHNITSGASNIANYFGRALAVLGLIISAASCGFSAESM